MTDKILIVTDPDDTLLQGIRVLHVQLSEEQSSIVSNALLQTTLPHTIINYVWKIGDRVDWLLDKISKCDIILFNADCPPNGAIELIIGWVAAQHNSYYFGILKDLHMANNRAIYSVEDISILLEKIARQNEQVQ
jgi:hypothetical protein